MVTPTAPQGRTRPAAPPYGAAVAVLGEVLVDEFADGRRLPGGAPFNVARWLAAFGVPTLFVSRLGATDDAGALLRAEMRRIGLHEGGLQRDPSHATGVVRVLPDAQGHRFEIAADSAWDHIDAAPALPLLQAQAPGVVCFGTLALRHAASCAAITTLVQATPALRFVDLNLRAVDGLQALAQHALALADWVKVNDEELQTLLGWFVTAGAAPPWPGSAEHAAAVQALVQHFELQRLIVTRGAQGWMAVDAAGNIDLQGPAVAVPEVHDTVGAGDAFAAAMLAACLHGQPLARALPAAAWLAAAVCTWPGALPADLAVITQWRAALGFGGPAAAGTAVASSTSITRHAPGHTA